MSILYSPTGPIRSRPSAPSGARRAKTYPHWLVATARQRESMPAVSDADVDLTYGALLDRVHLAAHRLVEAGLQRGQPVCLAMGPSADYCAWILGCLLAGGVAAPVNTRLAVPEVSAYVDRLEPALLVSDREHQALFAERAAGASGVGVPSVVVDGTLEPAGAGAGDGPTVDTLLGELDEQGPAIIFPTGGTTGLPKGAFTDHEGLLLWAWNIAFSSRRHQHELELYFSPFFHVSLMVGVFAPLFAGGAVFIEPTFDAERAVNTIAERGITRLMGAPTMFSALADVPNATPETFGSITEVIFGAAASTAAFAQKLMADFPNARISTGFGATELASGVTKLEHHDLRQGRVEGVGRANPGCEIRIVDDAGHDLAAGEIGNVIVRSPWQTLGYWNQPTETAQTYRSDGFIDLGDLGVLDESGWLSIVGRTKEMIISGGENVYPIEVEQVLADDPAVGEVVVFGVPDERWGERVEAVVTPALGQDLDPDRLRSDSRRRLGGYKVPKQIHLVESIPLTPNNKPDRRALTQRYGSAVTETG